MVPAGVALTILLGTALAAVAARRHHRTVTERAHWVRWDAECREFGCHDTTELYDWEQEGWA